MVNVIKQKIFDIIIPADKTSSKSCPFVFYPINIHGCNHPSNRKCGDIKECSPKICPYT